MIVLLLFKDDFYTSPYCAVSAPQYFRVSLNGMRINVIRYELLTSSLRHFESSFSNSFLGFYSYEIVSSSVFGKKKRKASHPSNATPRHVTPRYARPSHATQRNATPRHATQRNTKSFNQDKEFYPGKT